MSPIEWTHDRRRVLLPISILRPSPATDLTSLQAIALVDTGASVSGIPTRIIRELGLLPMGRRPLMSAQGLGFAQRYVFRVGISRPDANPAGLPFIFDEIMGFELVDGTSFDAVLGMDILSQCDFNLRRDGTCSLVLG